MPKKSPRSSSLFAPELNDFIRRADRGWISFDQAVLLSGALMAKSLSVLAPHALGRATPALDFVLLVAALGLPFAIWVRLALTGIPKTMRDALWFHDAMRRIFDLLIFGGILALAFSPWYVLGAILGNFLIAFCMMRNRRIGPRMVMGLIATLKAQAEAPSDAKVDLGA